MYTPIYMYIFICIRLIQPYQAHEQWKEHFNVSKELDDLSESHIASEQIREEMNKARVHLKDLALSIEKVCVCLAASV